MPAKKTVLARAFPIAPAIAPVTPFIPPHLVVKFASKPNIQTTPSVSKVFFAAGKPSSHLINLKPKPKVRAARTAAKRTTPFAHPTVHRTLSGRTSTSPLWSHLLVPAFFRVMVHIFAKLGLLAFKLLLLPLTVGLKMVDKKFDVDRLFGKEAMEHTEPTSEESTPLVPYEASVPQIRKPRLRAAALSFAGLATAIILPLQAVSVYRQLEGIKVEASNAGALGIDALHEALQNGAPNAADLATVANAFSATRANIEQMGTAANVILASLPGIGDKFTSGKALVTAGENLSKAAALLGAGYAALEGKTESVLERIIAIESISHAAAPLLTDAKTALDSVSEIPEGISEEQFGTLHITVTKAEKATSDFLSLAPVLKEMLGKDQSQRYLVLFQNNAELRPTGGFIGSFALMDIDRGRVVHVEVPAGGSYDLQGYLKAHVLAPEPLQLVSSKWQFQDANWFPDFPTSAKKAAWFYQKAGGPSVDGVIAINANVLASFIGILGPIPMPEYGITATADTVLTEAQRIVESDEARETNKPKQFIADLLPKVLAKALAGDKNTTVALLGSLMSSLGKKDIQMYLADETDQARLETHGWTGSMKPVPEHFDALEVVRANIAGQKTDTVMRTNIDHRSAIGSDGGVTNTVTISLSHEGVKGAQFTGVRNVTYLRVYVPEGSKLISASGDFNTPEQTLFEAPEEGYAPDRDLTDISGASVTMPNSGTKINNEFGRTVFGNWIQTDPGGRSIVSYTYTLPFRLTPPKTEESFFETLGLTHKKQSGAVFGLLIGRQSGADRTSWQSTLTLPQDWYIRSASPAGIASTSGWAVGGDLNADTAIGVLLEK